MGFFRGFSVLFFLVFLFILTVIIISAVKGLARWNKNNHFPRLTVSAVVVAKRTQVSHHHHSSGTDTAHAMTYTTYYVTFQVQSGDRMELCVSGEEYGMLAEGDSGSLHFQGTRYLGFDRI